MARRRGKSMADMVADLVREEGADKRKQQQPRPGTLDRAGTLWSQSGVQLALCERSISVERAVELLLQGAEAAFEDCGCGGEFCQPEWATANQRGTLAHGGLRHSGGAAPTWIDAWIGGGHVVVFLHGEFEWLEGTRPNEGRE